MVLFEFDGQPTKKKKASSFPVAIEYNVSLKMTIISLFFIGFFKFLNFQIFALPDKGLHFHPQH